MNPTDNTEPTDSTPIQEAPTPQTPTVDTDQTESTVSSITQTTSSENTIAEPSSTPQTSLPAPKPKINRLFILLVILAVVIVGGIGYTVWAMTHNEATNTQTSNSISNKEQAPSPQIVVDDETKEINSLETELNSINDADYSDSTLSDSQLYNN